MMYEERKEWKKGRTERKALRINGRSQVCFLCFSSREQESKAARKKGKNEENDT